MASFTAFPDQQQGAGWEVELWNTDGLLDGIVASQRGLTHCTQLRAGSADIFIFKLDFQHTEEAKGSCCLSHQFGGLLLQKFYEISTSFDR